MIQNIIYAERERERERERKRERERERERKKEKEGKRPDRNREISRRRKRCASIDNWRTQESWNDDRQTVHRLSLRHANSGKFEPRRRTAKERKKKKWNPSFEVKFDACSMIKETREVVFFCNLIER